MTIAPHPAEIRHIVFHTLQEVGANVDSPHEIQETILVDSGNLMARTYLADDYQAVWLLDEGVLQFTNADGQLLRRVNLYEEMPAVRIAA